MQKKAVQFGAGLIGRGFIAELLHDSGYKVVFADVVDDVVDQIKKDGEYPLFTIEEDYAPKIIDNIDAYSTIKEPEKVIDELQDAQVLTTSVMATNLDKIAPLIAKALKKRVGNNPEKITVMACENAMMGSDILKEEILKTGEIGEEELEEVAVFPNTAVDRMVFAGEHDGKKGIEVGKNYELAIEKDKLVNPDEEIIKGAHYVDNLEKYLQRKIFIINNGHAVSGYLGKQKGYTTLQEVLNDPELLEQVKATMMESARALEAHYGFDIDELETYMNEMMIDRWTLPGVVDEIHRISREPIRKISKGDRILGPAQLCEDYGIDNVNLLRGVAHALKYENPEDSQAVELQEFIKDHGVEEAITKYTGLTPEDRMYNVILEEYHKI